MEAGTHAQTLGSCMGEGPSKTFAWGRGHPKPLHGGGAIQNPCMGEGPSKTLIPTLPAAAETPPPTPTSPCPPAAADPRFTLPACPQLLMGAKAKLEEVVDTRFDDALNRRDHSAVLRFTKLYKPLGKQVGALVCVGGWGVGWGGHKAAQAVGKAGGCACVGGGVGGGGPKLHRPLGKDR